MIKRILLSSIVHRPSSFVSSAIGKNAFTLVEVLATFVLIAIILPVAMKGLSLSARMADRAKRQIEAGALAETRLNEILLAESYTDGDQSGEFSDDNAAYRWTLEVADRDDEELLQELKLSVAWEDALGETRAVILSTLVYTETE